MSALPNPSLGEDSAAFRTGVDYGQVRIGGDIIFIRRGPAVAGVYILAVGTGPSAPSVDSALLLRLARIVDQRLAAVML